jgi:hypothetical protein
LSLPSRFTPNKKPPPVVIPAQAGTQGDRTDLALGSRLRENDDGDRTGRNAQ